MDLLCGSKGPLGTLAETRLQGRKLVVSLKDHGPLVCEQVAPQNLTPSPGNAALMGIDVGPGRWRWVEDLTATEVRGGDVERTVEEHRLGGGGTVGI